MRERKVAPKAPKVLEQTSREVVKRIPEECYPAPGRERMRFSVSISKRPACTAWKEGPGRRVGHRSIP